MLNCGLCEQGWRPRFPFIRRGSPSPIWKFSSFVGKPKGCHPDHDDRGPDGLHDLVLMDCILIPYTFFDKNPNFQIFSNKTPDLLNFFKETQIFTSLFSESIQPFSPPKKCFFHYPYRQHVVCVKAFG